VAVLYIGRTVSKGSRCEICSFYSGVAEGEVLHSLSLFSYRKLRRQASSKRREPLLSENT
jgi:hypothetical protein